jgi:hypothetical protein
MKNQHKMITTNIRLSQPDWLETKAISAQLGMSLNEYVTTVVVNANKSKAMTKTQQKTDVIWNLSEIAPPIDKYQPKKLNQDDELIYE